MTDFSGFDFSAMSADAPERPHLRRDPLPGVHTFRLRLSLNESAPEIWREVLVRSDMTLPVLHQVIQACFAWWDYHLYRFSLGGGVYDRGSELFLCPFDEQEEDPYQQGTPARLIRVGETVQRPGDVLNYLYDFGDDWDLTITLVEVLEREDAPDAPVAEFVTGERAAPPEDCGGRRTTEEFAELMSHPEAARHFAGFDPAVLDTAEIVAGMATVEWWSRATASPDYVDGLLEGFPDLVMLHRCLPQSQWTAFLGTKLEILEGPVANLPYALPRSEEKSEALSGVTAFLRLIGDAGPDGVKLTASGYLPPKVVEAAMVELPSREAAITKGRSESKMRHILEIREALTSLKLVRKYKGHLKLTRWGTVVASDPERLWGYLVEWLAPLGSSASSESSAPVERPREFIDELLSVILLCVATTRLPSAEKTAVADLLTASGWRDEDGREVTVSDVSFSSSYLMLLGFIGPVESRDWLPEVHSDAAAALAREALLSARG